MSNILVTGGNGQLGSEIRELSAKNSVDTFYFTDEKELDITSFTALKEYVEENKINVIINCAAYTAVDKAELEPVIADKVNHLAVRNLVDIAKEFKVKLVHISTDYVFDGTNHTPYKEEEKPNPQSVYGKTKLDGENILIESKLDNTLIIRTSWVYGCYGSNFVKTILKLAKERDSLGVIYDQIGTPTYAKDLAKTILEIIPKIKDSKFAIYHYTNEGVVSWYDFAKEIIKMAKIDCKIDPIETYEYPLPAKRPHYSLLNKSKIKSTFGIEIPFWKEGLDDCLRRLGERR